jgi:LPXTG-motif cell wall-anchored protein
MKALLSKIKEPLTHDYVIYGLLTLGLAAIVFGLQFFYGSFGLFENQVSKNLSNARNSPWLVAGGASAVAIALTLFFRRRKNRPRKIEHTDG